MATLILFLTILSWVVIGFAALRWAITLALVYRTPQLLWDIEVDWVDAALIVSAVLLIAVKQA